MRDQLGVARNSKSKNEDGYYTGRGLPRVVAVGVLPASTGGALQLVLQTLGSEPTPPVTRPCCLNALARKPHMGVAQVM